MASQSQLSQPLQDDELLDREPVGLTKQQKVIGVVRIIFGVVWAVAAFLKWQPAFIQVFMDYITGSLDGQPPVIHAWILMGARLVHTNPTLFGYLAASVETILAICFILGLFTNTACVIAICWSFIVWSVAEGFGGPYQAGQSTDIGTAFPYLILSVLLLVLHTGLYFGLDRKLAAHLGRYSFLASGPLPDEDDMLYEDDML